VLLALFVWAGVAGAQLAVTGAGQPTTASTCSDPNWSNVVLLIGNDNAASGSTTFIDQSSKGHNMSAIRGSPAYSNTQAPSGMTAAIHFTGSSSEGLTVGANSDFEFGSGNFTLELFFYPTAVSSDQTIFTQTVQTTNTNGWDIEIGFPSSGDLYAEIVNSQSNVLSGNTSSLITANAWHHAAFYRSGTSWYLAVDGTVTSLGTHPLTISNSGNPANIAALSGQTGFGMDGYVASARITKGIARYGASNFTAPSLPLPHC
jgi:hypothetical protein